MNPCRLLVCQRIHHTVGPVPHLTATCTPTTNKLWQTLKSRQTEHSIPDGIACSLLQMGFRLKLIGRCTPIGRPLAASLAATRTPFMLPMEPAPMFLEAHSEPLRSTFACSGVRQYLALTASFDATHARCSMPQAMAAVTPTVTATATVTYQNQLEVWYTSQQQQQ